MRDKSFEDTLLERFLTDMSRGAAVATEKRYTRILRHLQFFLDQVDVAPHLGTDPAAILEVERDFGRHGAFLRIFGATELVCCLPEFLDERWLPSRPGYARTQISLIGRLLRWLKYHRLIDMSVGACAFWEAEAAVKQARLAMRIDVQKDQQNVQ